jgi:hypothetical protein
LLLPHSPPAPVAAIALAAITTRTDSENPAARGINASSHAKALNRPICCHGTVHSQHNTPRMIGLMTAPFGAMMSLASAEVQKAALSDDRQHTQLGPPDDPLWEVIGSPSVLDKKRYKELTQKDVALWGYPAKVTYEFFDNKLSGYYIGVTVYDPDKTFQEILGTLKQQFGEGKVDPKPSDNLIRSIDWNTAKQKLSLWITKKDEKDNSYYVGMRSSHKQFAREIEDIIAAEKKKYF